MASVWALLCLVVSLVLSLRARGSHQQDNGRDFILDIKFARVVQSAAGELRDVIGTSDENRPLWEHDVSIGYIDMEPETLLLPQYLDAAAVLLVLQGEASVTWIQGKYDASSQTLKAGDLFSLPAGTVFYMMNSDDQESLKVISMIDTSSSLLRGQVQHFFVGGGVNPSIVLSGFKLDLIAAAFKVNREEVLHFFSSQRQGPIIRTSVQLSENKGDKHSKKHKKDHKKSEKEHKDERTRNLFDHPVFSSERGWLATSGRLAGRVEVFATHLKAGSMTAPHWNPRGCEFGVVTKGFGSIQIAFPNGTNAADEPLEVGSVFYVPQFFPSIKIAASDASLEFAGFTVVTGGMEEQSDVQFLAGKESVLRKLDLSILALSLDVPESLLQSFLSSQPESIILSSAQL